ncbi:MAG: RIP metalloprotease RseP, partial [Cyanobacteria bacterium NC_groundwater_1444_Ag_S-0.65um_54_12]|nr:RIP metalloprotease RseP [Cyanobacteria bacterium NC_groundwater_1444_Ag_S-0.65um_54_12]
VMGQPARQAGLKDGDRVIAVAGQPLSSASDFQSRIRDHAGKEVLLVVRRGTTSSAETLTLKARPAKDGKIGVAIAPPVEVVFRSASNPLEVLSEGTVRTGQLGMAMGKGLWLLATRQLPLDMIGGPIAIVQLGATTVKDFYQLCLFTAMISLDLAIVNFLPVPGLDGGHILLIVLETIFRRPLPRRVEEAVLQIGLLLLLGLGMLLIVKDILALGR